jgi:hypothetical protein
MVNLFLPSKSNGYKPYLLRKSALAIYSILILLVNSFGGLIGIPQTYASSISADNIIRLTNLERENYGLNTLKSNSKLGLIPFFDFKIDFGEINRQNIDSLLK